MNNYVTSISDKTLFRKLNFSDNGHEVKSLFNQSDLSKLKLFESKTPIYIKLLNAFRFLIFLIYNPSALINIVKIHPNNKRLKKSTNSIEPIRTCILKARITAAFHPRKTLEIGTYLGWGAASFKTISPSSMVYSINSRSDKGITSNNQISNENVGQFYKQKGLHVYQLWGDSAKYDFTKLSPFDVVFIDGDHSYNHVTKDLEISFRLASKAILIDDYIPHPTHCPQRFIYGYWTHDVTTAVNDFLASNYQYFSSAYWIIDSKICLLIKK